MGIFSLILRCSWEADQGPMLSQKILHFLSVKSIGVVDCRIVFNDGSNYTTIFLKEL